MSRIVACLVMGGLTLFASPAPGVDQAATENGDLSCDYRAGRKESDPPEQAPAPDFRKMLQDITSTVALDVDDFAFRAGDVPSAKALVRGGHRKIVYNSAFMAKLKEATNEDWAAQSILAHEVGHHLKGHTLAVFSGPESELQADRFAGWTICQLGGTWTQAESALSQFGERQPEGYPELSARLEAVYNGWSLAMERGCPWSARVKEPPDERLTELTNSQVVTQENASDLLSKPVLAAGTIRFENVQWEVKHPLILYAERISFGASSVLRGRDLALIAREIEGGRIDVSGGEGEDGGRILVAASVVRNTVMAARGGDGHPGKKGERGDNGVRGRDGIDGDCGPAGHGSSEAENGSDGKPGGNGEAGGRSGSGGEIALLAFREDQVETDVEAGTPGDGGRGGRGGRGGAGGRGGRGCVGESRQEPAWPDGLDGRDGDDGKDGLAGGKGSHGQVVGRPTPSLKPMKAALAGADLDTAIRRLRRLLDPQAAWLQ